MCRVLHLVEHLYQGGIERLLEQLAKHSPKERYSLYFYAYQTEKLQGIGQKLQGHGTPVFCYNKPKGYDFKLLRELVHTVRHNNIQVIHTHDFGPMEYAIALKARFPGLRLIHTHHTLHDFLRYPKYVFFFQFASLFYSQIVGVSDYVTEELKSHCPIARRKLRTIYNGLDFAAFEPSVGRAELRPGRLRLVNVSRISAEKNLIHLLRTCAALKAEGVDFELHHAGSGSAEEELRLKQFVENNGLGSQVFFHGFQEDVKGLLANGDIFVSPSFTEGHPVAVLEAMAAGLLCLCSDIPAHRLLSNDGILFFELNGEDLLNKLREISKQPATYAALPARAQHNVRSSFSMERMIQEYGALYA
ncbi:MAG: glycosyltransferase family 4 protein [Bdellovibrionaceae bacterium]|nr:glycosyltransferase family 4 protein [Bdellovibrionales bacterium]MCB9255101.1 glycosyltransferase family 4 protein [Pseudobdellovibrionaceae bacterium]